MDTDYVRQRFEQFMTLLEEEVGTGDVELSAVEVSTMTYLDENRTVLSFDVELKPSINLES